MLLLEYGHATRNKPLPRSFARIKPATLPSKLTAKVETSDLNPIVAPRTQRHRYPSINRSRKSESAVVVGVPSDHIDASGGP